MTAPLNKHRAKQGKQMKYESKKRKKPQILELLTQGFLQLDYFVSAGAAGFTGSSSVLTAV